MLASVSVIDASTFYCDAKVGTSSEYGIPIGLSLTTLRKSVPEIIAREDNELTPRARALFRELYDELVELEGKIAYIERKINQVFKSSEPCQRLAKIMGVGPLTSTALVAAVGDANVFKNGRNMAAWLG